MVLSEKSYLNFIIRETELIIKKIILMIIILLNKSFKTYLDKLAGAFLVSLTNLK